jgi:hypothetical protein
MQIYEKSKTSNTKNKDQTKKLEAEVEKLDRFRQNNF